MLVKFKNKKTFLKKPAVLHGMKIPALLIFFMTSMKIVFDKQKSVSRNDPHRKCFIQNSQDNNLKKIPLYRKFMMFI